jgi:hypothetical protein
MENLKICSACSQTHNRPKASRCHKCERKAAQKAYDERNREKVLERQRKYRDEHREIIRAKSKLPKTEPLPIEKSKCIICGEEHDRPRSKRCIKCEKRSAQKASDTRNKEKIHERQRIYRENNREYLKEARKRSYDKKKDYYRNKSLEYFIKKKGLPADYKRWKRKAGDGSITNQGYKVISIPGHPNAFDDRGRLGEHTYIMSQHLGRPLHKGETVHHINGDRLDNRLENLELWHRSHPPGQRVDDKIDWCLEFLGQYLADDQFRNKIANWVNGRHELD